MANPNVLTERLFARLTAMYGSKLADLWAGTNPDEVKAVWGQALRKFTPETIGAAIHLLENEEQKSGGRNIAFPPTLPEFTAYCRQAQGSNRPEHQPFLALPVIEDTEETARKKAECMATASRLGMGKVLDSAMGSESAA